MQIGKIIIEPWNRKNTIWRLVALAVLGAWVMWGVVIFQEGKQIDNRIAARQQQELTRQAIKRRKAILEQEAQQRTQNETSNIVDTLPEGGEL